MQQAPSFALQTAKVLFFSPPTKICSDILMALLASPDRGSHRCEAGPSRLVPDAPLTIKLACRLQQPDGASWFGTNDKAPLPDPCLPVEAAIEGSLADRYAETLWLGELHTGLSHFLNCIDRLRLTHELEEILLGLCQLIRSNSAISRRHQAAARGLLRQSASDWDDLFMGMQDVSEYERGLVQRAIDTAESGLKSSQFAGNDADPLRERWTSSMESRE